ncbi:MAG: methionyl-tRNA formyltransferase [SAR324 cluster bacterium]|nr:methionyl-tRNA formyltransferase [SAR324 cluster bacterium]
MRIVVNGQQAFGKEVLEALLNRGDEVIAVYCAPEKEGQRPDPLKEAALAHNLPVYQPKSFRKPEVWEELSVLKPDLCVMAYVTLFVPDEFLNMPTHGTIQYHPSLLPKHRGPSSINWPIMMGSSKTGLSIFWPDKGLDTGPILLQKEVEIGPDDTLGSVYFDKLFPMGVAAMLEGVDMVKAGNTPKAVQDESQATYESWCKAEDVELDWNKPAQEVYNMIRGANPQPGAWTRHGGKVLQIFDAGLVPAAESATPGQVTEVSGGSFTVACNGGQIIVKRVKPEDGKKVGADEYIQSAGLQPGAQLGG